VKRIAIIGGIGTGKSLVTKHLEDLGFPVIDADLVSRDVVKAGSLGLRMVVDAFGKGVLKDNGEIDRALLATVVFADSSARRRLERITHPLIAEATEKLLCETKGPAVFLAIPLFGEGHRERYKLDEVWALSADPQIVRQRLSELRGMTTLDIEQRVESQTSEQELLPLADVIFKNEGSSTQLLHEIDAALEERGLL
jgi:dephospho-CoA kinase